MGFGGISIWSLLLILIIVLLLFGTKKLRNIGTDLGGAIKGFKSAIGDAEKEDKRERDAEGAHGSRLEGEEERAGQTHTGEQEKHESRPGK